MLAFKPLVSTLYQPHKKPHMAGITYSVEPNVDSQMDISKSDSNEAATTEQ